MYVCEQCCEPQEIEPGDPPDLDTFTVFTDASTTTDDKGQSMTSIAYVDQDRNFDVANLRFAHPLKYPFSNNTGELAAIYIALTETQQRIGLDRPITIYTDSEYARNLLENDVCKRFDPKHQHKKWKHVTLISKIVEARNKHQEHVSFKHVRAHVKGNYFNHMNSVADQLARMTLTGAAVVPVAKASNDLSNICGTCTRQGALPRRKGRFKLKQRIQKEIGDLSISNSQKAKELGIRKNQTIAKNRRFYKLNYYRNREEQDQQQLQDQGSLPHRLSVGGLSSISTREMQNYNVPEKYKQMIRPEYEPFLYADD